MGTVLVLLLVPLVLWALTEVLERRTRCPLAWMLMGFSLAGPAERAPGPGASLEA